LGLFADLHEVAGSIIFRFQQGSVDEHSPAKSVAMAMHPSSPGGDEVGQRGFSLEIQLKISNLGWQNSCDGLL
jgi:hypothetical protein